MIDPVTLLAAYPKADKAVAFTELVICTPVEDDPTGQSIWDLLVTPSTTPWDVVKVIRAHLGEELSEEHPTVEVKKSIGVAYLQTFDPQFLMYIKGKMGCV